MLSGAGLPNPRLQLRNLIADVSHIADVLPTAPPCVQNFGTDLLRALQILESVDQNWDGLTAAASRSANDDLDMWFKLQPAHRSGKQQLTQLFIQVQEIVHALVELSSSQPHEPAETLHLRFQVVMGLFSAVFREMRDMEEDFVPRNFETIRGAIAVSEEDAGCCRDVAIPEDGRDISALLKKDDESADLAGHPSRMDVHRAAMWKWRHDLGVKAASEGGVLGVLEEPPSHFMLASGKKLARGDWKPIQLPSPQSEITRPEPMVIVDNPPQTPEFAGGKMDKGPGGLSQTQLLSRSTAWLFLGTFVVWLSAAFSTLRSIGRRSSAVNFSMKISFVVQFIELGFLIFSFWLQQKWHMRKVAMAIVTAFCVEALALAVWSIHTQKTYTFVQGDYEYRGYGKDFPECGKRSGLTYFFDDCGSWHAWENSNMFVYIFSGCRAAMILPPLIAIIYYPGPWWAAGRLNRRGYKEVRNGCSERV